MDFHHFPPRHQHYACFDCRKGFKAADEFSFAGDGDRVPRTVLCPDCRRPMRRMGRLFRVPRRRAVRAWRRLARLIAGRAEPVFEEPLSLRTDPLPPTACPACHSRTGWDGRRCPYCGHSRGRPIG